MKMSFLSAPKKFVLTFALFSASMFIHRQVNAQAKPSEFSAATADSDKSHTSVLDELGKDVIRIQNNNGTYGIARVYSSSGKKQSEAILKAGINGIDISMLAPGEYIICITMDGGKTFNQKFSKE
jgi:hypothetical protein